MDGFGALERLQRALAEGDLEAARSAASELARLEGASPAMQLAAEVVHELRQPLLGIKAYVQMLGTEAPAGIPPGLLLTQVERMEQILSDFTRLASRQPAPLSRVNLGTHVREALRWFQQSPDASRIQVDAEIAPDVELEGNGRLLEQLTLNLLNNARDALGGRGRVKLLVTREGARPALYVADWGAGIPPDVRDRIFEPYVTTKGKGSGLGLAVCRRIAQEHQAQIRLAPASAMAESPPPATVFQVLFPPDAAQGTAPTRRRVLVVDDEPIILAVFEDLLRRECELVTVESGEEAVARLRGEAFDLIIADKNLPGVSGLEVAQEACRAHPGAKVILMTGYPSLSTAQQALELGVIDYLLKPFDDIREVREKIRSALASPPIARKPVSRGRVDVYEDNPASARQIAEALALLGMEPNVLSEPVAFGDEPPAAVIVSWDFTPAHGRDAVWLARSSSRGAPFIVLAEHLTLESTLESVRGGAAACLPKLLTDPRALSRELARALRP